MKAYKRIFSLLLALCLCAGLFTGCQRGSPADSSSLSGSTSQPDSSGAADNPAEDADDAAAAEELHIYQSTPIDPQLDAFADFFGFSAGLVLNGRLYLVGQRTEAAAEPDPGYQLLSCRLDGSDPRTQPLHPHPGMDADRQSVSFSGVLAGENGEVYVLESVYTRGASGGDGSDASQGYYLHRLDDGGDTVLNSDAIELPLSSYLPGQGVVINGVFYLVMNNASVFVLDEGFAARTFSIAEEGVSTSIENLFCGSDGSLLISYHSGEDWSLHLRTVDPATGSTIAELPTPAEARHEAAALQAPDGRLYFYNSTGLYAYDEADGTGTLLCDWMNSDLDFETAVQALFALEDGSFLAAGQKETGEGLLLTALAPIDPSLLPQKTVLRLACKSGRDIRRQVLAFNRASENVRILLVDYGAYDTSDNGFTGAAARLNADIRSGQAPDILLFGRDLPLQQAAAEGLLADLYPLLDADPELSREELLSNVLTAGESGGQLAFLIPDYYVSTAVAAADAVTPAFGWTYDDFFAVLAQHPNVTHAFPHAARDSLLLTALALSGSQYVDYAAGTCSFDSPAFRQLLDYTATYPEQPDYSVGMTDLYTGGQAMLNTVSLFDFFVLQAQADLMGCPVVFQGFPTPDGSFGSAIVPAEQLAVSAACPDKAAAWQFVRTFLSADYQQARAARGSLLPLRADVLQQLAQTAVHPADGTAQPVTQADADAVLECLNHTTALYWQDSAIWELLQAELPAFFDGSKSADETAAAIQARVSAYLCEGR